MCRGLPSLVTCLWLLAVGACAPDSPTAFVEGSVKLDGECVATASADTFWAGGLYDIASEAPGSNSGACDEPYRIALKVNSFLRANSDPDLGRAEPNYLNVHSAEVKLMNLQRQTLLFEASDGTLPNPFLGTTVGIIGPSSGDEPAAAIAWVEVIPAAYAPFLSDFVNDQILAEMQLFGTTTGAVDIDFQPFTYPIEVCDGCLTICSTALAPTNITEGAPTRGDLADGECDDNAGADGRFCVDPGCPLNR